jgi:hypothetical protein
MEEIEIKNLNQDDVLDLILDFPLQVRGRKVIITNNAYEPDGTFILSNNQFSEIQYVVAVGDYIKDLKPGQKVFIDVERMVEYVPADDNSYEKVPRIKLKTIEVGDNVFSIIDDSLVLIKDNR